MENSSLQCAFCRRYLFNHPRQLVCGDRICGDCFEDYQRSGKTEDTCPVCQTEIPLNKSFRDKAVETELKNAVIRCINPGCPWEGEGRHFKEHLKTCKFSVMQCPNVGCGEKLYKSHLENHLSGCKFTPILCDLCGAKITQQEKDVHQELDCPEAPIQCINDCGETLLRKELTHHLRGGCQLQARECEFKSLGCQFTGNMQELSEHESQYTSHHLKLVNHAMRQSNAKYGQDVQSQAIATRVQALDQQIAKMKNDIAHIRGELSLKLQPIVEAVVKVESTIQQLQEGFGEMALLVQTLQATSYSGTFVWKIPEIERRRHEAKIGKTISLYSAPFYTSRHGYKMCLRVYMDGDGGGKGTHLSFFLTLMRGEYDALLLWPFKQAVTLMLLDQDRQKDIVQSFRPEPTSSSFQRPRNEMSIASGCPMFCPLSLLDNPSYVKDDTMFLKCVLDLNGLQNS